MVLQIFGAIMAAIGMLMIFTHTVGIAAFPEVQHEGIALKRLFYGILLVIAGLLLIFYSPI